MEKEKKKVKIRAKRFLSSDHVFCVRKRGLGGMMMLLFVACFFRSDGLRSVLSPCPLILSCSI